MANDAMIKALQDQVKANEIALDGVRKEEALGNRTVLDVLNAFQLLLDSRSKWLRRAANIICRPCRLCRQWAS